jgi:integrase
MDRLISWSSVSSGDASSSSIRREDIDLATATLWIPKPKGGKLRAFRLPLSDAALAVVERVPRSHNSKWLFPADSKSGHIEEPRPEPGEFTPWADADGEVVNFTVHGGRDTFISAGHAAGVSDRHMMLLANHAVPKSDVHGGYVSADPDALRPSQQAVTDFLRRHGLSL